MEFIISRTSHCMCWENDEPPCEGAYRISPLASALWYIKINSLEELLSLEKRVGHDLILGWCGPVPTIEIYDDWRE